MPLIATIGCPSSSSIWLSPSWLTLIDTIPIQSHPISYLMVLNGTQISADSRRRKHRNSRTISVHLRSPLTMPSA